MGNPGFYTLLRGALHHDLASQVPAFRSQVDHIIRAFDQIKIMLDDHYGMAFLHQFLKTPEEYGYIMRVESDGGFVKEIQDVFFSLMDQVVGQFDALQFPARECRGGLSQPEVPQTHL